MAFKINWDALGVTVSIACAIHCALLPLVLSTLPLFGVNIIENIYFEYGMIALAFFIGVYSLFHGYKKHHHNIAPIIIFSLGMGCLVGKQIFHLWHNYLLIPAVLLIILSHYLNFKFCRHHNHGHKDDCDH